MTMTPTTRYCLYFYSILIISRFYTYGFSRPCLLERRTEVFPLFSSEDYDDVYNNKETLRNRRSNRRSSRRRRLSDNYLEQEIEDYYDGDDDGYSDDNRGSNRRNFPFLKNIKKLFQNNEHANNSSRRDRKSSSVRSRQSNPKPIEWDIDIDMKDHLYEDDEYLEEQRQRKEQHDSRTVIDEDIPKAYQNDLKEFVNERKNKTREKPTQRRSRSEYRSANFEEGGSRHRRRRPLNARSNYDESGYNKPTWTQEEVSSWFDDDDDDDDEQIYKTRKQRRVSPSLIDDAFDNWRRADHEQRKKAAEWDRAYSYDIRRSRRSQQAQSIDSDIVDVEAEDFTYDDSSEKENGSRRRRTRRERQIMEERRRQKILDEQRELEELERVPPKGMGAWGPDGKISMDIREKAVVEALKEIEDAKEYVKQQEEMLKLVEKARQEAQETAYLQRKNVYNRRDYISATEGAHLRAQLRRLDTKLAEVKRDYQEADETVRESQVLLQRLQIKHSTLLNQNSSEVASLESNDNGFQPHTDSVEQNSSEDGNKENSSENVTDQKGT